MNAGSASVSKARPGVSGDIWGGFAAMLVALPSSIAFGISIYAIVDPAYVATGVLSGILGAMACGLVAPWLGGAPRLISAPCAPAAAILGGLAGVLIKQDGVSPATIIALLGLVGLISGGLQMIYGTVGGGKLIKYIPYPVVSGYLSGVGCIIIISQIPKFLGGPKGQGLWAMLGRPEGWNGHGIAIGIVTIVGMLIGSRLTKKVPATIIGLSGGLLAYGALALFIPAFRSIDHNKLIIGSIFSSETSVLTQITERWQGLRMLGIADIQHILVTALTLSILLSIDTLKTCLVLDTLTRSRHDSNRELLGQGAANLVAAVIGGMPGAGTMGATLVNLNSGGGTRRSGFLEGVFVVVAVLILGPLIGWIPIAALAGILMVVAARMIDFHSLHLLRQKATVFDFVVIASVVAVAVGGSLIAATATGLTLAVFLFMREQMRGAVIRRKGYAGQICSKQHMLAQEKQILSDHGRQCLICELQGSLFFGTTDKLFTQIEADLRQVRYIILDMRHVQSVDFTAAHLFDQIADVLTERSGFLAFSHVPAHLPTGQDLLQYFNLVGVVNPARNVKVFDSLNGALEWVEDRILEEHALLTKNSESPLALNEIELMREFEADEVLGAVQACIQERAFKAGQSIFKTGEMGDELFLIRRGIVRILLPLGEGREHLLATFARGNFFGEVAFLDKGVRSANAVAETDTELYVISRPRVDELAKAHPVLGIKLFARLARGLAARLRYADQELRILKES